MNVDIFEGDVSHKLQTHHHHPGYPEEEDVKTCHQHGGGIELLELFRLFRPSHGGERPEGGAEPGIQDIGLWS